MVSPFLVQLVYCAHQVSIHVAQQLLDAKGTRAPRVSWALRAAAPRSPPVPDLVNQRAQQKVVHVTVFARLGKAPGVRVVRVGRYPPVPCHDGIDDCIDGDVQSSGSRAGFLGKVLSARNARATGNKPWREGSSRSTILELFVLGSQSSSRPYLQPCPGSRLREPRFWHPDRGSLKTGTVSDYRSSGPAPRPPPTTAHRWSRMLSFRRVDKRACKSLCV